MASNLPATTWDGDKSAPWNEEPWPPAGTTCDKCKHYGELYAEDLHKLNVRVAACAYDVMENNAPIIILTRPKCAACECYEERKN